MKTFPAIAISKSPYLPLILISILAAIIYFARLGSFSLFNPDEGLYAEPALEMLKTGEYITTTLNYVVRFTKPPLIIWAMAVAYKIFGVNEFAARLVCALSGFLLTIITYLFTNKYFGRRVAFFSACILLSAPLFVGVGRMAITDMPLSLLMSGSLFSFFHAWKQKQKGWLYLGYFLTALAIMTKGPVGLLLPVVILSSFFFLTDANKNTIKFLNIPLGLFIVALIALPWFVIEITITKGAYFNEFIMRENFARFTSVVDSHKGPWFYHIAAVCGGLFPWSILLPESILKATKDLYASIKKYKGIDKSALSIGYWQNSCKDISSTQQLLLFNLITAAVTVGFFSLSVSKLLPYTLPAFPALAIIIGHQWDSFINNKEKKKILIYCSIFVLLYLIATFASPIGLKFLRNAPPELIKLIFQYACLMTGVSLTCTFIAARKNLRTSALMLFSLIPLSTAIFLPRFLSVVNNFWEGEIPHYAQTAALAKKPLIVYRIRKPGVPFYYGQKVLQSSDPKDLKKLVEPIGTYYLITNQKYLSETELIGFKVVANKGNFALLALTH